MKATDLRIGNLVYYTNGNVEFKITEIDNLGFGIENDFETTWVEHEEIEPIPLTEKWLLEFGFEKSEKDKEGYQIWIFNGDECIFRIKHIIYFYLCDTNYFGTEIRYVHDIQNLYFALTGQELTI